MPELPEVETIRRGILPLISGKTVTQVKVHNSSLRWPVPPSLAAILPGQKILDVARRSKYLLIFFDKGTLLLHFGMTGHLRVVELGTARLKHDHVEIFFQDGSILRFNDSRRFGSIFWTEVNPLTHPRLKDLGPEPFDKNFNAAYLFRRSRLRTLAVKLFLMDAKIVVGVGNIYANEALFRAKIDPRRASGQVTKANYARLVKAVNDVLEESIAVGGTTIRDFTDSAGAPGYFKLDLQVYGRGDQPCVNCNSPIWKIRLGQRSTFFCPRCQK